jgi:Fe-S-cluster containining protein
VEELAPDHRQRVRDRFAQARASLAARGLLERLHPRQGSGLEAGQSLRTLGLEYFALGIPCPFLESESCSIHPDRPLACREYLVVSDPAHCAKPSAEEVATVELPRRLSVLFARLAAESAPDQPTWLPLILALDEDVFDGPAVAAARHTGIGLFERLVGRLSGNPAGDPAGPHRDGEQAPPGLC